MAQVADIAEARAKAGPKVFSCGKCQEQGAMIMKDGHILCGANECHARMAADWYVPTNPKSIAKHMRPMSKVVEGTVRYYCAYCGYGFFHMQADQSFTCYNKGCRKAPLFRWHWHESGGRII